MSCYWLPLYVLSSIGRTVGSKAACYHQVNLPRRRSTVAMLDKEAQGFMGFEFQAGQQGYPRAWHSAVSGSRYRSRRAYGRDACQSVSGAQLATMCKQDCAQRHLVAQTWAGRATEGGCVQWWEHGNVDKGQKVMLGVDCRRLGRRRAAT